MMFALGLTIFVAFVLVRLLLRYRDGDLSLFRAIAWAVLWIAIVAISWRPEISETLTRWSGVGRPVDLLYAISIVFLFYALFSVYLRLEQLQQQLTQLVRELALKDLDDDA
jgi:hypothetical protein